MPTLDNCIADIFEPGNIGASSGQPPVSPSIPTFEDPETYDPDAVTYSLDYSKFWNSAYFMMGFV